MDILLTSAGRRSYLVEYFKEALRQEGQSGYGRDGIGKVHVMNSQPAASFLAADKAEVSPLIHDDRYIPFVKQYCLSYGIGMVIPLFDIDLPVLAAHREEFEAMGVAVVVADLWAVELCNDKWKTCRFLEEQGIRCPATFQSLQQALSALDKGEIRWPVMVKPRWGMGSLAVYEAEDARELEVMYRRVQKDVSNSYLRFEAAQDMAGCALIQEKLDGQEYGLDVMNDLEGRFRSVSVKRKLAMRSGETDCAETEDSPALSALGEQLATLLRHRGNLDVDIFLTGRGPFVLEMNARFGGGYPFSHMAGVDLPRALVSWRSGREPEPGTLKARPGVRSYKDLSMVRWEPGV